MELILLFFVIQIFIGIIIFKANINYKIIICVSLFFGIILLLSVLFKHYILNQLWIIGELVPILLFIVNIEIIILYLIKSKNKYILIFLLIPIISVFLYMNNIDKNIALNIELKNAKHSMEKLKNNMNVKNGYFYDEYFIYTFFSGVTDNWIGIIYDNNGLLEYGLEIIKNNESYYYLEEYEIIKKLFGGDIIYIKKLEENWYLCNFT